jgi:hypothetical protein
VVDHPGRVGFLVLVPGSALAGIAFVRRGRIALGWVAGILSFVGFLDVCTHRRLELWADLLLSGGARCPIGPLGRQPPRAVPSDRAPHYPAARCRPGGDPVSKLWRPGLVGVPGNNHLAVPRSRALESNAGGRVRRCSRGDGRLRDRRGTRLRVEQNGPSAVSLGHDTRDGPIAGRTSVSGWGGLGFASIRED